MINEEVVLGGAGAAVGVLAAGEVHDKGRSRRARWRCCPRCCTRGPRRGQLRGFRRQPGQLRAQRHAPNHHQQRSALSPNPRRRLPEASPILHRGHRTAHRPDPKLRPTLPHARHPPSPPLSATTKPAPSPTPPTTKASPCARPPSPAAPSRPPNLTASSTPKPWSVHCDGLRPRPNRPPRSRRSKRLQPSLQVRRQTNRIGRTQRSGPARSNFRFTRGR